MTDGRGVLGFWRGRSTFHTSKREAWNRRRQKLLGEEKNHLQLVMS
jgi:hypothetical protein